jgi:hypothetical protein
LAEDAGLEATAIADKGSVVEDSEVEHAAPPQSGVLAQDAGVADGVLFDLGAIADHGAAHNGHGAYLDALADDTGLDDSRAVDLAIRANLRETGGDLVAAESLRAPENPSELASLCEHAL